MWWDRRASASPGWRGRPRRLAAGRGVEVFWAFCESHARDVPFHAVTRLLRAGNGVADLDGEAARARVREQLPDADPQDLLLLDDLLGIADPDVALPADRPGCAAAPVDRTDQHRRRWRAPTPALFIIEDAHWIDAVSESMLADFLSVIPRTPSMVLITSRPEYQGALTRLPGAQAISLAPLGDSDAAALLAELLGSDPPRSVSWRCPSPNGPQGTHSSSRRWYGNWCSAACWPVSAVAMCAGWMLPR